MSSPGSVGAIDWAEAAGAQTAEVRYSRYIGRVGALAVALGVGMAASTGYGLAPAAATPGSGSTANAESGTGAEAETDDDAGGGDDHDGLDTGDDLNGETTTVVSGEAPPVSIDAQTTGGDEDDVDETDGVVVLDEDENAGEDAGEEEPETVDETVAPVPPVETESGRDDQDASSSGETEGVSAAAVTEPLSGTDDLTVQTDDFGPADDHAVGGDIGLPEVFNAAALMFADSAVSEADTPSTVVPVGTRDPIAVLLAVPAAVVSAAVNLVVAIFEPIVGPGAPLENGLLWGMLAWVRRQTNQALSNDTPSVEDSRQVTLVLNPGQVSAPIGFGGVDADGDPLVYSVPESGEPGGPTHGTITIDQEAGTWTYTPGPDWDGASVLTDSFTVTVSDVEGGFHLHGLGSVVSGSGGHASTGTIAITVTPASSVPVAAPDSYSTPEDTVLNVAGPGVLGNDTDPEGDPLSAALHTGPNHGSVDLNADGSFTYTPDDGYNGPDSFSYTVSDGSATSAPATVTIDVAAATNAPPVFDPETVTRVLESPSSGVVTGSLGVTDPDGDVLTYSVTTGPTMGTVDIDPATGTYTYTPTQAAQFKAALAPEGLVDSFTLTVSDNVNEPVTFTVTDIGIAPEKIHIGAPMENPVLSLQSGVVAGPDGRGYVLATSVGDDGEPRTIVYTISPDGDVDVLAEFDSANGGIVAAGGAHVLSPDGSRLYVLRNSAEIENGEFVRDGVVEIINTTSGNSVGSVRVGDLVQGIAIASDGTLAVASRDMTFDTNGIPVGVIDKITLLDAGGALIGAPIPVEGIPLFLEVSSGGTHVYYFGANQAGGVLSSVLDTATGQETEYLAEAFPDTDNIIGVPTLSPDGKQLFTNVAGVNNDGTAAFTKFVVIDSDSASPTFLDIVHEFNPDALDGYQPAGDVAFSPDGSVVYVVVVKVDENNPDGLFALAAIDTADYSVISITPTGEPSTRVAMSGDGVHGYFLNLLDLESTEGVASIITIVPAADVV
ncbi:Ig-like domain-containing protein [Mycolicibacterium pulveris]|uniref:Ig-like domain-containing protein n=1 Tax=Mycolicibacterium pulveris TaxID=36813 RepID=UPI003CF7AA03